MMSAEKVREYYRRQGEAREQQRIVELLSKTPFIWMGTDQIIQVSRDALIAIIKGENNE